jgi:uncharacterized protein (UPF0332 family)
MPDIVHSPSELAYYRLDQAARCLQTAERSIGVNDFEDAANRSYYCIFHAMRAVLALDRLDFKKHSGVISKFLEKYIKTGIFPVKYSDAIKNAFEIRNDTDYEDFYTVSKSDVATQVENAREFLTAVKEYIGTRT